MNNKSEYLKMFDEQFNTNTMKNVNEINMPILHIFFESIQEYLYATSQDYKEILKENGDVYNKLNTTLNKEQQKLFKNYEEEKNKMNSMLDEKLFMFGFLVANELKEENLKWKNNN